MSWVIFFIKYNYQRSETEGVDPPNSIKIRMFKKVKIGLESSDFSKLDHVEQQGLILI